MNGDPWDDDELRVRRRPKSKLRLLVAHLALGLALVGFVGMLAWGAFSLLSDDRPAKRQVVHIVLLAPPPPPPPALPPEVKAPEPEIEEEVKAPEPEPQPNPDEAPPPGEQLGLDAEGSGSGDSFGLVGKKGGQDITTIGGGAGGNRAQFAWFTGIVQSQIQEYLQRNDRLRAADYRVVMRLWFGRDGRIERYELVGSSGDAELDRRLKLAMDELPQLKQPPPSDLPQPVKLRVTSRGAG